ncbi:hypothetical protein, variant [Aphanomyces astaci]|uniref:Uncharacterized protein n=1 Tax=Aphanomyces astaci TaxID=112090 RepID=W4G9B2_APHAT|nr:hypothetical protein, variant [Aphanomyces astaci]ETV75538.1 hypothetical protein, variant [Aphanomyces astaci]|eukprot:XP_009835172.1 hypothetical protein, variant [Aphanomyces astaci]
MRVRVEQHERQHDRTDMGGSMTTLATQTIDRLETAMRHLEDMYGYVTNADLQGHARSSMLTELGSVILEATKAADATIALFHDTLASLPPSPRSRWPLPRVDAISSKASPSSPPGTTHLPCPSNSTADLDQASVVTAESPPRRRKVDDADLPLVHPPPSISKIPPKQRHLNRPSSPPKPTAAALLCPTTRQLLMDLHVEFHAKKAEFKNLRRRVGDAKRHTKMHIQDHTHVLRGLERLQHDMPL